MTKYKRKQVGHAINLIFSIAAILFCIFVTKVMVYADIEDGSGLFFALLASSLIVLMIGNIRFSIIKLRYLASIKHKFLI